MTYLVHLKSAGAPNGVGKYQWADQESVVAVDSDFAAQLLAIRGGGFSEAQPYDARPPKPEKLIQAVETPDPEPQLVADDNRLSEGLDLVSPTARPRGRPPKKG